MRLASALKSVLAIAGFIFVALDCHRSRLDESSAASAQTGSAAPILSAVPAPPPIQNAVIEDERNTITIFQQDAPSTVFVTQKQLIVDYFRGEAMEVPAGTGSGFIWDKGGHVVTNFHVVKGAQGLTVTTNDHKVFEATVVGVEPRKDIAVLKINAPADQLHPIKIPPKGRRVEVGQKALAIGNPFGLDQTLTTGIVSALGREVRGIGGVSIRDMIQTDAAINPGNSGGPLLDSAGQLIGMNTMIYSSSGASAGIGFAVPVSTIARVVPQIIKTGRAEQVGLGIQIDPAQRLERRAEIKGVIVLGVVPNTPAAKAGLRPIEQTWQGIKLGDVIVGIDKEDIKDYDDLYNTLDKYHPGDSVTLTVLRAGRKVQTSIELVRIE